MPVRAHARTRRQGSRASVSRPDNDVRQDLPALDAAVRRMRSPDQPERNYPGRISKLGVKAVRLCRSRQERVFSARKARTRR